MKRERKIARIGECIKRVLACTLAMLLIINTFNFGAFTSFASETEPKEVEMYGFIYDTFNKKPVPAADMILRAGNYYDPTDFSVLNLAVTYDETSGRFSFQSKTDTDAYLSVETKEGYLQNYWLTLTEVPAEVPDEAEGKVIMGPLPLTRKRDIAVSYSAYGCINYKEYGAWVEIKRDTEKPDTEKTVAVAYGQDQSFEIIPDQRYEIESLTKDDTAVSWKDLPDGTQGKIYTLEEVKEPAKLQVKFTPKIKLEGVTCTMDTWTKEKVKITGKVTGVEPSELEKVSVTYREQNNVEGVKSAPELSATRPNSQGEFEFEFTADSKDALYTIEASDPVKNEIKAIKRDIGPINIDNAAPVIDTVVPLKDSGNCYITDHSVWVKNGATIQVEAHDEGSGVENIIFSAGGVSKVSAYSDTNKYILDIDTKKTEIKVSATDKMGNESEGSHTFKVDNVNPTFVQPVPKEYYSPMNDITIDNPFRDAESGLGRYEISYNGGKPAAISLANGKFVIDKERLTEDLGYHCVLTAYDNVGNSISTEKLELKVDRKVPAATFNYEKVVDSGNNISVEGQIPKGSALYTSVITTGKIYQQIETFVKGFAKKFKVFDITLQKDNVVVQPKGAVTVTIPVPEGFGVNLEIYRMETNGTMTKLKRVVQDGTVRFQTEHFSVYTIVDLGEKDAGKVSKSVKTGDTTSTLPYVLLSIGAIGVVGMCLLRRKRIWFP